MLLLASFVWKYLKKSVSVVASLWFAWLIIALLWGCGWGIVATVQANSAATRENHTSPSWLKEDNADDKRQWILTCINNAAAGVLGGATMADTAINACGSLGDKLFPEKDWEHVAMINWERYQLGSSPQEETD